MDFVLCALSHGVQHTDLTSLPTDNIQSMVIYLSNEALLRKHLIFLSRQKILVRNTSVKEGKTIIASFRWHTPELGSCNFPRHNEKPSENRLRYEVPSSTKAQSWA